MKPTIPEVRNRFKRYHASFALWGSLHIVLEDGNTQDGDVRHCMEWAEETGDVEGRELAAILLSMSRTQRRKLAAVLN